MKLKKEFVLVEWRTFTLVACLFACTAAAYGDVYDDAIFWFRGGTNVTANGRTAVKGDLFDRQGRPLRLDPRQRSLAQEPYGIDLGL